MRLFDLCVAKKLSGGGSGAGNFDVIMNFENHTPSLNPKELVIGDTITAIPYRWLYTRCDLLERVTLGKNVKYVREGAFQTCSRLEELNLNDKLEEIGPGAFLKCNSLASVKLPASLKTVYGRAFAKYDSSPMTVDMTAYDGSFIPDIYDSAFTLVEGFKFLFRSQEVLDIFNANYHWSTYFSQYSEVAT